LPRRIHVYLVALAKWRGNRGSPEVRKPEAKRAEQQEAVNSPRKTP